MFACRSCNTQQTVAAIAKDCGHMRCLNCFVRLIGMQPDGMTYVCPDCQRQSLCIIAADLANGSTFQLAAKNGVAKAGIHYVQTAVAEQLRQFLKQNYPNSMFCKQTCPQPAKIENQPQQQGANPMGPLVPCPMCKQAIPESQLQAHLKAAHPRCVQCGAVFANQQQLDAHMPTHSTVSEEDTRFNQLVTSIAQRDADSPIVFDPFAIIQFKVDDPNVPQPVARVDSPDTEPEYQHDAKRCKFCNQNFDNLPTHYAQKQHAACELCTKLAVKKKAFLRFQMHATQQAVFQHMHDDHSPCGICGNFFETPKVWLLHKKERHPAQFSEEDRVNLANQPTAERRDIRDLLKRLRAKYPK